MPGLEKPKENIHNPKEINANFVGCQLKKASYQNENAMKHPSYNNNQNNLTSLPQHETLHETSADSSNSHLVFFPESTNNINYL